MSAGPHDPTRRTIRSNGIDLSVVERGEGPAVVIGQDFTAHLNPGGNAHAVRKIVPRTDSNLPHGSLGETGHLGTHQPIQDLVSGPIAAGNDDYLVAFSGPLFGQVGRVPGALG